MWTQRRQRGTTKGHNMHRYGYLRSMSRSVFLVLNFNVSTHTRVCLIHLQFRDCVGFRLGKKWPLMISRSFCRILIKGIKRQMWDTSENTLARREKGGFMGVYILHFTPDDKIEISPFYCSQCRAKKTIQCKIWVKRKGLLMVWKKPETSNVT